MYVHRSNLKFNEQWIRTLDLWRLISQLVSRNEIKLTVTAFFDLMSLPNNHCDSPWSSAPVGVYTDTDQRHFVHNEQLRVVNLVQIKNMLDKNVIWLCSLFLWIGMTAKSNVFTISCFMHFFFFTNSVLTHGLFSSSSFKQINLLT